MCVAAPHLKIKSLDFAISTSASRRDAMNNSTRFLFAILVIDSIFLSSTKRQSSLIRSIQPSSVGEKHHAEPSFLSSRFDVLLIVDKAVLVDVVVDKHLIDHPCAENRQQVI